MKKLLLIFLLPFLGCSQNAEIKPYADYLKTIEKKSSKDYILEKFKKYDIVILCERDHRDLTQYELIKDILSDDYFKQNIKNLFTEVGVINLQPQITEFLKTKELDSLYVNEKLAEFQFNSNFSAFWEMYNYHYLLRTIYDINDKSDNKISYYPSDVEFDWSKVRNAKDYQREYEIETEPRDSIIAYNIINQFEKIKSKKNKKALVILNFRHAFKMHTARSNGELQENTAKYLFDYFGNRATNILINQVKFNKKGKDHSYSLIQNGKWDATFKSLGLDDLGFDFKNNIFGKDILDIWNVNSPHTYEDTFDGLVFYKPIEEYKLLFYFDGFIPEGMEEELFRRLKIESEYMDDKSFIEKLKDEAFRNRVLNKYNTKREYIYPNIKQLIKDRDKYIID